MYDTDGHTTALITQNGVGNVAVAMSANVASQYGWYQITGTAVIDAASGFAATAEPCYPTSTAGEIDDSGTAGDMIYGMTATSAIGTPAAGQAEVSLSRPVITDNSN